MKRKIRQRRVRDQIGNRRRKERMVYQLKQHRSFLLQRLHLKRKKKHIPRAGVAVQLKRVLALRKLLEDRAEKQEPSLIDSMRVQTELRSGRAEK